MASGDITPGLLSGSSNGRQIKVAATATAGTLLHTAVSGTGSIDVVTLEACNTSSDAVTLTIEWGGTTSPDDLVEYVLGPERGPVVVADRRRLNGGVVVRAFASTANVVTIYGHVDTWEL